MLQDTKRDLTDQARRLTKPYEVYSIDELADAYCEAVDTHNETLKNIYISALVLRFWHKIGKMYRSNTVAPTLEQEDFFWWLYEAIEYACKPKYRGWQNPDKNLNAEQCINKCIETIRLQKYYNLRLDKYKAVNSCISFETPVGGQESESARTLEDVLESKDPTIDTISDSSVVSLIQSYVDRNKIVEAILLDNIAFNNVQKNFKKIVKTTNAIGDSFKYTEHSSEFWPFRLIQIVSKLPATYKSYFMERYKISEEKLTAILEAISKTNNQRLYRCLDKTLDELRATYLA